MIVNPFLFRYSQVVRHANKEQKVRYSQHVKKVCIADWIEKASRVVKPMTHSYIQTRTASESEVGQNFASENTDLGGYFFDKRTYVITGTCRVQTINEQKRGLLRWGLGIVDS